MNKAVMWVVIVAVVVGGGLWVYSRSQPAPAGEESALMQQGGENPNENVPPAENENPSVPPQGSVKTFAVSGNTDFIFSVSEMRVKKGDTVTVVFTNAGGMHDWRVDEFGAATKVLAAGGVETISFVADKTGSFEYYCSVGNHRAMGMKGTLIVE